MTARTVVVSIIAGAIVIAVIVFGVFVFFPHIEFPGGSGKQTDANAESAKLQFDNQTEVIFLNGMKDERPKPVEEWWAARSDHRLLAAALLRCKAKRVTLDRLPRSSFSELMMDLTPSGNHEFRVDAGDYKTVSQQIDVGDLQLTPNDQVLLSISDAIARARLTAAQGASTNVPLVERLGFATLIVSALATLFVTLQGRMRPVDPPKDEKPDPGFWRRFGNIVYGPGAGFRWVAFFAIVLSIAGTSLTALKQVYDPSRNLTQNTRALLDLRQLHQEVILGARCDQTPNGTTSDKIEREWAGEIRRIVATIVPESGAYANLDGGAPPQRVPSANDEAAKPAGDQAPKSEEVKDPAAAPPKTKQAK